jgi:tetratricopeptide (TPR) repeat protein
VAASEAGVALEGQLARAYFFNEQPSEAIAVANRVQTAAERADLQPLIADTLVTKGTCVAMIGRAREGLALIKAGGELAESIGLAEAALRARINRSGIEGFMDPGASLESLRQGLMMADQLGMRSNANMLLANACGDAMRTGAWQWALDELRRRMSDELELTDRAALLVPALRMVALRGEEAPALIADARATLEDVVDHQSIAELGDAEAWLDFAKGRFAEARQTWRRSASLFALSAPFYLAGAARAALWGRDLEAAREDLDALDRTGVHGTAIDTERTVFRAGVTALSGRPDEALTEFRSALRSWQDLRLPWDEALTGLTMALTLDPTLPDVRDATASARRVFVELGAAPFLAKLDQAAGRSEPSLVESSTPTAAD